MKYGRCLLIALLLFCGQILLGQVEKSGKTSKKTFFRTDNIHFFDEDAIESIPGMAPWKWIRCKFAEHLERNSPGHFVILFTGRIELHYFGVEGYMKYLQEAIDMAKEKRALPILVTLPDFGDASGEVAYQAARKVKQLALRQEIPVIDLYSAQKAEHLTSEGLLRENGILWYHLSHEGKQWVASHLQIQFP